MHKCNRSHDINAAFRLCHSKGHLGFFYLKSVNHPQREVNAQQYGDVRSARFAHNMVPHRWRTMHTICDHKSLEAHSEGGHQRQKDLSHCEDSAVLGTVRIIGIDRIANDNDVVEKSAEQG